MRTIHKFGIARVIYLILICRYASILCQGDDESTVEIVLFNNATEKIKSKSDVEKEPTAENKSKELRNILTALVSHLLAGSRLKNNLLKNYDEASQLNITKGDSQKPDDPGKAEKTSSPPPQEPTIEMLEKIKRIPVGYRTFCSFVQNLDLIRDKLKNRPGIRKIQNILVYEEYHLTDYWGRLKFKKEGDKLVDETGYFEGVKVNSFEDMLTQGRMTRTGFVQKKEIGENEVNENLITMKLLLSEIAKEKNTSIHNVVNEGCNMSMVEELVFYGNSPSAHDNEIVHVCVCSDSFCKEPCKDIIPMKMENLEFRD
ncbi:putative geranyltransferase [Encephalitozoon hellem]|uniref:Geranyltransferase n=1 Tax=Encephalitozoon hellem TaxID=27973 RepID=A0ABY8CPB4_ENCHE|nr:putative geranyltransferase [Encephalitozoon hellem]